MRLGELALAKEHILCTDHYFAACPASYYKTDVFYHGPLMWRGQLCVQPSVGCELIVSGHSDYPVGDTEFQKWIPKRWYSVNSNSQWIIGLPLGITNNTSESHLHPIYGNLDILMEAMRSPYEKTRLAYMNFNVITYPVERSYVWNFFARKDWVTQGSHIPTLEGRRAFLSEMRTHKFVICPRGNGLDTHRIWEALYLGCIPIVIDHLVHKGWRDLPILFVDSWEKVTPTFLEGIWEEWSTKDWNLEKLDMRYWVHELTGGRDASS